MRRAIAWWAVLAGLWLALVDNPHADELAAGLVATLAGTVAAVVASERMSPGVRLPLSVVRTLPHLGRRVAVETVVLLRALFQTVVLRRPVRGRWRSEPIDTADTPQARGERVFVVLAGSVGPNRVVGETEGGRLVVHELVSADEPLNPLARG